MMDLEERLSLWIKEGENDKVEETLVNLHVHHIFDQSKTMLLHCAAKYDNRIITQLLLNNGCDVDAQDPAGLTPLMVAVKEKHEEVIRILLSAGADVLILNNENKSALDMFCADVEFSDAISYIFFEELRKKCPSDDEISELLIRARCHAYQAAYLQNKSIMIYMMKRHAFLVQDICQKDLDFALKRAITCGSVCDVKLLLNIGANVKFMDHFGQTALSVLQNFGATIDQPEILKILLNCGLSSTSLDVDGYFQILPVLITGSRRMIRVLLEWNIDFTAKDTRYGRCVLHHLARNFNAGIIEEIKFHHKTLDVNVLDEEGTSPLYWATYYANANMVAFLLSEGADVNNAHRTVGVTPLYHAYSRPIPGHENQYEQCIQLLLEHDADSQFILKDIGGNERTIFDVEPIETDLNKIKPVIAHLAVLEGQGKLITEKTYAQIHSHPALNKYLNRCRRLLKRKISGSATLFELLTVNRKKLAQYLKKEEMTLKLKYLSYKQKLGTSYAFYRNKLERRYLEGIYYNKVKDKAAESICTIFGNIIREDNLIIDKIIDYLNNESLGSLYHLFIGKILDLSNHSFVKVKFFNMLHGHYEN